MDKKLVIILIGLCFGCALPNDIQKDDPVPHKIKEFEFQGSLSTYSDRWQLAEDIHHYQIELDKRDYREIDSITFTASLRSSNNSSRAFAELYNLTDSASIGNSVLTSQIRNWLHSVNSEDIARNIPDYPVKLTIRLRSEYNDNYVEVNGKQVLRVYYK